MRWSIHALAHQHKVVDIDGSIHCSIIKKDSLFCGGRYSTDEPLFHRRTRLVGKVGAKPFHRCCPPLRRPDSKLCRYWSPTHTFSHPLPQSPKNHQSTMHTARRHYERLEVLEALQQGQWTAASPQADSSWKETESSGHTLEISSTANLTRHERLAKREQSKHKANGLKRVNNRPSSISAGEEQKAI